MTCADRIDFGLSVAVEPALDRLLPAKETLSLQQWP
jgi:hypothetical protein